MHEAKLIEIEIENMKNRHKEELKKIRRELKRVRKARSNHANSTNK